MSQSAKFWDKLADRYSKSPVRDQEAYQKKLEITRTYFKPDMEIFEFACGTGSTAIAHAPYVKHILAIDISSKMLEIARDKAEVDNIENITFKQSTIEEFDESENSFDVVMAHSILHLLESPESAMTKAYGLLKPGGVFVSSTVCLKDSGIVWRIVLPIARFFRLVPYVNILGRSDLKSYFADTDFEIDYKSPREKKKAVFIVAKKPT